VNVTASSYAGTNPARSAGAHVTSTGFAVDFAHGVISMTQSDAISVPTAAKVTLPGSAS
jgi:hypothetical protein